MSAQVEPTTERVSRASEMFRALGHRNFRLFWAGAFLSNTGTWMQTVAQGWLVLHLTDSAFWLGVDGFMATVPGLLLTLVGGVFADLVDRKRLLIATQIGAGLAALVLGVLVATGVVQVWMILLLSFVTGCCLALASPSYQAITIDLVGREDLSNAIALNSTQFQLSRIVGPVLAGLTISALGLAGCFIANGLSYIAVVAALVMTRISAAENTDGIARSMKDGRALWQDLIDGFRYVLQRPRVRMLLLISAVTSLFGGPYLSMVPLFARNVLRLDENGLALMMSITGGGAFCGALLLAFLGNFQYKGWFVLGGALSFAICLTGFALSSHVGLSLALLFGVGVSMVLFVAVINILLQQLVTDQMRGRVMSMFVLSFLGTVPFGNLITGAAAERYGAPRTLAACGLISALFMVVVIIRNKPLREL
ncbi:MAG: MFS transporter [Pyrinomonadaceae bacterium]|nr:MFS transporter [Pyrinomonadaceae bacterium]